MDDVPNLWSEAVITLSWWSNLWEISQEKASFNHADQPTFPTDAADNPSGATSQDVHLQRLRSCSSAEDPQNAMQQPWGRERTSSSHTSHLRSVQIWIIAVSARLDGRGLFSIFWLIASVRHEGVLETDSRPVLTANLSWVCIVQD